MRLMRLARNMIFCTIIHGVAFQEKQKTKTIYLN